ncbi:MAG: DUF3143 domain-containing protein [Cyanobacteria bacterium P01_A01_bin.105]
MTLPAADTPLYNHPLPDIEAWLVQQGCYQDPSELNRWTLEKFDWKAELMLDVDSVVVRYLGASDDGRDVQRSFKYSLSREDLESAIFAGP